MVKLEEEITLAILKVKAKFEHIYKWKLVQSFLNTDITFVFLFLGLYLLGYAWNWKVLVACFGIWIVIKEVFKYWRIIAKEFNKK